MTAKLELKGIKKAFVVERGVLPVVAGLDLTVLPSEFVAIVGPSGCGKSTLMNLIAGFEAPDSGTVLVDGTRRTGPNSRGILISQQGSVFPWLTARQNVLFALNEGTEQAKADIADHYLGIVGLKGFENSYPHELSGGMLKRLEFARALVVKPSTLFMDEAFSGLDALASFRLRSELLRVLAEEHQTALLVTHDVEEAIQLADRIVVLSRRPTRVQRTFDVPFPHPRKVSSAEAQELREAVLRELAVES
jgi:ABC-type nitrate/sulfonate/bicarbonate transport system ATPase subunit